MTAAIEPTLLLDPQVIDDPYPFYRRLRDQAPVWLVPGTDVCIVSRFSMVAEATGRVEDFSSNLHHLLYRGEDGLPARLPFGEGMNVFAVADPPIHTVHRRAVFPDLVARRIASLRPEVERVARDHLDEALGRERIEYMSAVANMVPITLITGLIGFRDYDLGRLLQAAFDSTALVGARHSLEQLNDLLLRSAATNQWITEQFEEYRDRSADDLLGTIARAIEDGAMSDADGISILQNLLSAGGESTTSLLGNSVRILAEHPDLQEQLRSEPELIPAFVEEALRLESPFRFLARHAPHDTSVGDVEVPAGTTVLLFWGAANRDEREFDQPDEVRLDREMPEHHLAFGRGIHLCVGRSLARMEGTTVVAALLERTRHFALDPDDRPRWSDSLQVRRHAHLPLRVDAR